MNHPDEQNPDKSPFYTSPLIRLFEQKGYQCEAINCDNETIYVMTSDFSREEKSPETRSRIIAH